MAITPRTRFIFVGERPSHKAEAIGATWDNGKLAARTLHDVLRALGIEPSEQHYLNLWRGAAPVSAQQDASYERMMLAILRWYAAEGHTLIGMGRKVCRALAQAGVPHRFLIHPAARGAIRLRERYLAHARAVLLGEDDAAAEDTNSVAGLPATTAQPGVRTDRKREVVAC